MWYDGKFKIGSTSFRYEVKICDDKISKIQIRSGENLVADYDEKWLVYPENDIYKEALQKVLDLYK